MRRYELSCVTYAGDQMPPFAILTADSDDVVSIEIHPNATGDAVSMAVELISNFNESDDGFSLNRLAVSYGGLREIDEDGKKVQAPIPPRGPNRRINKRG